MDNHERWLDSLNPYTKDREESEETMPENLEGLTNVFEQAAQDAGFAVKSAGYAGYNHGDEYAIELVMPDGFEAFVLIRESQDDEYIYERYEMEDQ